MWRRLKAHTRSCTTSRSAWNTCGTSCSLSCTCIACHTQRMAWPPCGVWLGRRLTWSQGSRGARAWALRSCASPCVCKKGGGGDWERRERAPSQARGPTSGPGAARCRQNGECTHPRWRAGGGWYARSGAACASLKEGICTQRSQMGHTLDLRRSGWPLSGVASDGGRGDYRVTQVSCCKLWYMCC